MSTIRRYANGRIRSTLPIGLVREAGLLERDDNHVAFDILCREDGISLKITIGPDVDPDASNVRSAVTSGKQFQLEFPVFMAEAWGLVDSEVAWSEKGSLAVHSTGTVTLVAPVTGWEPVTTIRLESALSKTPSSSIIARERQSDGAAGVYITIPSDEANEFGLLDDGVRLEISFVCLNGDHGFIATPTTRDRDEVRNSVAVTRSGPNKSQAMISAAGIATGLGVYDRLQDVRSIRLHWFVHDGHLLAYPPADVHPDIVTQAAGVGVETARALQQGSGGQYSHFWNLLEVDGIGWTLASRVSKQVDLADPNAFELIRVDGVTTERAEEIMDVLESAHLENGGPRNDATQS